MDFLDIELNEILNIFEQESIEILQSMDKNLFLLEEDPTNKDVVIQLTREAHSLKGSARMLGFSTIQDVVHKIEDVLIFIKDEALEANQKVLDVLISSLNHIGFLIEKTIEQKSEYISDDSKAVISSLVDVASIVKDKNVDKTKNAFSSSKMPMFNQSDNLIIGLIYTFSKARMDNNFDSIESIINILVELNNNFKLSGFSELFEQMDSIIEIVNLYDFTQIGEKELLDVNSRIDKIVEDYTKCAKANEIPVIDYYEYAQQLMQNDNSSDDNFDAVLDGIIKLFSKNTISVKALPKVLNELEAAIKNINNDKIKTIFNSTYRTLLIYKEKSKQVNEDTLAASREIFVGLRDFGTDDSYLDGLIKKVSIIEKMCKFNLSDQKQKKVPSETTHGTQDWITTFDSTDIKTLRIESFKLDKLVNQIGDLIISRIKTSEHLNIAKKIQNELSEWQKNFNKMGYYIKYFDRKYVSGNSSRRAVDSKLVANFNKQLLNLHSNHFDHMQEVSKEITDLFKYMQENDSKLNSISTEIEGMIKNMRILPLSTIFHLFPRMVSSIAKEKGKKIDFKIQGASVTADKKIIEEIKIPLIHILRNSIDHGIETEEERIKIGKHPVGKILISAKFVENKIVINIQDDGRGVDVEKIKKKAIEKGILTKNEIEKIDEEQLVNLVFYPGFSTGETVTDLSGRGLGLDIVHSKILQLNGRVDIFSQFQKGTIITIELPATMATIKAFIVSEQDQYYAIETSSIKTVLRVDVGAIFERDGKNYYNHNDELIPVYTMSQILDLDEKPRQAEKYTLLILKSESSILGVIVEKLVYDQEILHKKLEAPLFRVKNISGITTLANGETCLIINIQDLFAIMKSKMVSSKIIATNETLRLSSNFKYRILVVDDSLTTRTLQRNILSSQGYQVMALTNAPDALKRVQNEKFDLIITDYEMPVMNGLEFVKKIRQEGLCKNVPIMVLTSVPKSELETEFMLAGAQYYIQKDSFKQDYFIKCVDNFVNRDALNEY